MCIRITFYRPRIFTKEFWRHWKQRRKQGFIDEDTYSLKEPLAKFIAPRLKRFGEVCHHNREWQQLLDKMVWSMNEVATNGGWYEKPEDEPWGTPEEEWRKERIYYAKLQEGLTLFGRYFQGLWW